MKNLSIIIPVYNEEKMIGQTIEGLKKELSKLNLEYEIIAVNDGSTDKTKKILDEILGIQTIHHPYNKGYGASIKAGAAQAQSEWILTFDSDGQHRPEDIQKLFKASSGFDMVIGAREGYQGPIIRRPGKRVLRWVAEYLVKKKIPDLNSGLRLIKKEYFVKYFHLLPSGFSWTTTTTLAFLKDGLNVNYAPIKINKRQGGKSLVRPADALRMFLLILRIILLFSPLRIFLPISFLLFLGTLASLAYDVFLRPLNITEPTILLFISSLLTFFFGLLADQVAAIRREIK